jgi:biopolymer transport protein ExbD
MAVAGGRNKGVSADINITPLIDVVLVLLIIFMVLVPSMLKQLRAAVPRNDPQAAPSPNPPTVVKIGPGGELRVNGEPVLPAALAGTLRERLAQDPKKAVFFDPSDGVGYGVVVKAMDIAKGAGAATLAIVTRD